MDFKLTYSWTHASYRSPTYVRPTKVIYFSYCIQECIIYTCVRKVSLILLTIPPKFLPFSKLILGFLFLLTLKFEPRQHHGNIDCFHIEKSRISSLHTMIHTMQSCSLSQLVLQIHFLHVCQLLRANHLCLLETDYPFPYIGLVPLGCPTFGHACVTWSQIFAFSQSTLNRSALPVIQG